MRIGHARFLIIVRPISRNVSGVIDAMERLRLNQVPQKTPATRERRNMLTKRAMITIGGRAKTLASSYTSA